MGHFVHSSMRDIPHILRVGSVIVAVLVVGPAGRSQSADPSFFQQNNRNQIATMVQAVSDKAIAGIVRHLESYGTRYALYENRHQVAEWIRDKFLALGLTDVEIDSFQEPSYGLWQKNVIATMPGTVGTGELILGAHYDSQSDVTAVAPGADDNASGTAGILEVARVLRISNYQPHATIRFIAFGAEELGLLGSYDYADKALQRQQNILLMQNYDMIGYRTAAQGDWNVDINMYWAAHSEALTDSALMRTYTILTPRLATSQITRSDSWPFALRLYKAIFPIEHEFDFNPHYHSPFDSSTSIDFAYAAEIVKSAVALTLTMDATVTNVEGHEDDLPKTVRLEPNVPNPFNPSTKVAYWIPDKRHVRLSVFDILGREVAVLVDEQKNAGNYTVTWFAQNVSSGVYICRLSAGDEGRTRRIQLLR